MTKRSLAFFIVLGIVALAIGIWLQPEQAVSGVQTKGDGTTSAAALVSIASLATAVVSLVTAVVGLAKTMVEARKPK